MKCSHMHIGGGDGQTGSVCSSPIHVWHPYWECRS